MAHKLKIRMLGTMGRAAPGGPPRHVVGPVLCLEDGTPLFGQGNVTIEHCVGGGVGVRVRVEFTGVDMGDDEARPSQEIGGVVIS